MNGDDFRIRATSDAGPIAGTGIGRIPVLEIEVRVCEGVFEV